MKLSQIQMHQCTPRAFRAARVYLTALLPISTLLNPHGECIGASSSPQRRQTGGGGAVLGRPNGGAGEFTPRFNRGVKPQTAPPG